MVLLFRHHRKRHHHLRHLHRRRRLIHCPVEPDLAPPAQLARHPFRLLYAHPRPHHLVLHAQDPFEHGRRLDGHVGCRAQSLAAASTLFFFSFFLSLPFILFRSN